jgi:hypothetical protein
MLIQGENQRLYTIIDRLNARSSEGGSDETGSQLSDVSAYGGREARAHPYTACFVHVTPRMGALDMCSAVSKRCPYVKLAVHVHAAEQLLLLRTRVGDEDGVLHPQKKSKQIFL